MILVIDNYDSFVYNLVQYIGELGGIPKVFRNDKISLYKIEKLMPKKIIISPGPGRPEDAGVSIEVVRYFGSRVPILGVCLGHQCIGQAYGGKIVNAKNLMHGKTSEIYHDGKSIFTRLPNPFIATRYHSLVIDKNNLPDCLEISATTKDGEIMGIRHKLYQVEGVQFHPESVLTEEGKKLIANFLFLSK